MKKYSKVIGLITAMVFLDLLTKNLAVNYLAQSDISLFGSLWFKLVYNSWIAFGIPLEWVLQIVLSLLLVAVLIYYAYRYWDMSKLKPQLVLSSILAWAFWNLYERVLFSSVTDFIVIFDWYPAFNIADSLIFVWVFYVIFNEKILKKH